MITVWTKQKLPCVYYQETPKSIGAALMDLAEWSYFHTFCDHNGSRLVFRFFTSYTVELKSYNINREFANS